MNTEQIRKDAEAIDGPERDPALSHLTAAEQHLTLAVHWIDAAKARRISEQQMEEKRQREQAEQEADRAE